MLGHLVANTARLIRPYMEPILKVRIAHTVYITYPTNIAFTMLHVQYIRHMHYKRTLIHYTRV